MRKRNLFLILFLISLLFLVLDRRGVLKPFKERVEYTVNPLRARVYSFFGNQGFFLESLKAKKATFEESEKRKRELEACQYDLQSLKKENEDLRRLVQAPLPKEWAFLPAKVLAKKRYLTIDKGENDGVKKGMTVVFENFLVGKIVQVNPLSSLVILPFDSESKIAVKTETGVRGLLEGRFGTKIFLTQVLSGENLAVGQMVVTSGEGEYLSDLLIGKINFEPEESQEPFQETEVEPGLDYGSLTTVFLVRE